MVARDAHARLNARIDGPLAEKVAVLRRATRQTTTEVVRVALERYYDAVEREARPYDLLVNGGFIGCAEGPSDLSLTYKAALGRSLDEKHSAARSASSAAAPKPRRRARNKP